MNYKAVKSGNHCNILTEVENDNEEEEVEIQAEVKDKETISEYENAIKDINNKKNKSDRLKTYEDKNEGDLINASRVEIDEKNNTFQKEKEEPDL